MLIWRSVAVIRGLDSGSRMGGKGPVEDEPPPGSAVLEEAEGRGLGAPRGSATTSLGSLAGHIYVSVYVHI